MAINLAGKIAVLLGGLALLTDVLLLAGELDILAGGPNRLDGLDRELVGPGKLAELAVAGVSSAAADCVEWL